MEIIQFVHNIDLTTILIGLLVFLLVGYIVSMRERSGIPPGPTFLPIVGNLLDMRGKYLGKRHKYFEELKKKYGSVFRIYFGSQLLIVLNDFESIEEAFVKQKDTFSIRPTDKLWGVKQAVKDAVGIIWANGEQWKATRRMALQTLRDLGVGKSTLEKRIQDETDFILENLIKSDGKFITIREVVIKATTNIISIVVFGSRYDYNDDELRDIINVIEVGFKSEGPFAPIHELPFFRFIPLVATKMMTIKSTIDRANHFIAVKVKEHQQSFNNNNIRDFIDVVLSNVENNKVDKVSVGSMKMAILDLFLAGSDTTANTLDWAFLYMILNPDVQKKCQQEIDDIVGSSRKVNWSDRPNMPYVVATLFEVQRLGSIALFSLPHTPSKDTYVNGFVIPEGSLVYANLYACHVDEHRWKDPLTFNPDRFIDEDGNVLKQIPELIPFSTGPRICAGEALAKMELFLFFTGVLQRFHLTKADETELGSDGICGVTLSPTPYVLRIKSRI